MPRPRQRATLESGLKLDLNRLARRGFIRPGAYRRSGIVWTNNYDGEKIASGLITADMSAPFEGWFQIEIGELSQHILLSAHRQEGLSTMATARRSELRKPAELGTAGRIPFTILDTHRPSPSGQRADQTRAMLDRLL